MKDANVFDVSVEHFQRQHEVFPLVRVGDEQGLGGAVVLEVLRKKLLYTSKMLLCISAGMPGGCIQKMVWPKHAI